MGIALSALLSVTAAAQFRFDHWTINDGLPQNTINAIAQTRDGYLWLATNDGLARFDGTRFKVFNRGITPGIKNNRFWSLYEARDGTLWAGSEDSLLRYRDGQFKTYTSEDGLPNDNITWIEEDDSGHVWLNGPKNLSQWRDDQFFVYSPSECLPGHVPETGFRHDLWWSQDEQGLHVISRGRVITFTRRDGLPSLNIISVNRDQFGSLWINTDAGLARIRDPRITTPSGLQSSTGWHEDRSGALWHVTTRGLMREQHSASEFFPDIRSISFTFYEDREGSLWVGTTEGLYRARELGITTLTEKEGLPSNLTYSVLQDSEGAVWIGSWGGGVSRFHNGQFIYFSYTNPAGLYDPKITSLYEDRDGVIWIGSTGGISRFQDGKLTRFSSDHGLTHVWNTYQDRMGDFWFATMTGLTRFSNGKFIVYTTRDGLPFDNVTALLEDHQGALWVGTYGGLARLKDGHFTAWTEADGLSSGRIRCLFEDDAGALWIGTYDGGMTRLKDGSFTRYTTRDGLFGNGVFQILDDRRGYFWMSSNQGIFRVSQQELNDFADGKIKSIVSASFGKDDGMRNVECNGGRQPAGWKMRDGKLWFPTMEGIAIIDPAKIPVNPQPPPVVIEECFLDKDAIAFTDELRIPADKDYLEIHYTGLSFIKPEQVKFEYLMSGLDRDWVAVGNRRVAYFNHLPQGEYLFTVRAANSDGQWNKHGRSLRIIVVPPYWRQSWFVALVCLGIATAISIAVRRRFTRLRREAARQQEFARQLIESQERERQRIAAELHDSLSQDLILIRNWAQQGVARLDEQATELQQLTDISARSAQALTGVKEIIYNLRPHLLEEVGLSGAIKILFRKAASSSGIAFNAEIAPQVDKTPPETQINLYRIVQECVNNIIKHSHATEVGLTINCDGQRLTLIVSDNGRGFDAAAIMANGKPGSLGLTSLNERAQMIGGHCLIQSAPGKGATITVKADLQEIESVE